ncbi:MAG: DEAD/DEAH box helicase [Candidatus Bathyarchaeota archaeon]|nr:DEAD/DEAH box helicase [Candidatus Bathyarchaeota archaeon]
MQITSFDQLHLSPPVMQAIADMGWETPTPIQAEAMGPLLDGRDVLGQAQTGTGKTAAFGIPMIERVDPYLKTVQGLVLAPTRELAVQIADHLSALAAHRGIKITAIYGGEPIQRQTRALKMGAQIVVGTPGRILDHLQQGTLTLRNITVVVLDEADRMLDMGFIPDIKRILSNTPKDKQMSLFSATIDNNATQLSKEFMHHPLKLLVSRDEIAVTQIKQFYLEIAPRDKFQALTTILETQKVERAIVFARTQRGAQRLAKMLKDRRYDAKPLHGGLTQPQRDSVTEQFRAGKLRILVATDVAARGLDIHDVTHIINHNIPEDPSNYFHRIGRTARMEAEGTAISLVAPDELKDLKQIMAMTKTNITPLQLDITPSEAPAAAQCAKCGKPFLPAFTPPPGQPIYCPTCYKNHQNRRRPAEPGTDRNRSAPSRRRYTPRGKTSY